MIPEQLNRLEQVINQDYNHIVGIVVQKNGVNLYENYLNEYSAKHSLHVYSVTKSVVSILIGIAIDQGYIQSVDQKVLAFFPDYVVKAGEKTIQNITIRHLLTMTAPYKYKTEPYEQFFASHDPITDALDYLGGDDAIGAFHYSAVGGTHILSGILGAAIGKPILDFAEEHLFKPLGIHVPCNLVLRNQEEHISVMNDRHTKGWVVDPQGRNTASWGLFLTPLEMVALGQLYLREGLWNGRRIISAKWITESTRQHSVCTQWGDAAYGYLWWIIDNDSYAAMGDGGNIIYVNTNKQLVIAIASVCKPGVNPDHITLIKSLIEPMLAN